MSHEWGNYPENFTPKMYCGSRAILQRESSQSGKPLDLLSNRQSFERMLHQLSKGTGGLNMDTYRIPLVWQMYGHCDINANSLEEAIEIVLGPDTPLPDGSYVDDSVAVDYEILELNQDKKNDILTKQELRTQLQQGRVLNDLLSFGPGQDCEIFKASKFYPGDVVIYVPDVSLNHIPLDRPITDPEELKEVLSQCYTGQDFIDECGGDAKKAGYLFCYCDWQHPSSAVDELEDDPGQVEIMLSDLLPEAQKEVMRVLGIASPADGNYDVMPLFIVFNNGNSAIDQDSENEGD